MASRNTRPVSSPLRPGFHASMSAIAWPKSSSGAVVSTVTTAISAPVRACSSARRAVTRARVAGESTWAVSVTKPSGCGSGTAGAACETAASARSATSALRMVERGDDALHLPEVAAELGAQDGRPQALAARAMREQPAHDWQRPHDGLALGEHARVAVHGLVAREAQEVAEQHEEALERTQHERLERLRSSARVEEERPQPQELAARLVLALAAQRRGIGDEPGEGIGAGEHAVAAVDVVELHGEDIACPLEPVAVDDERHGEPAAPPAGDDGGERLEDLQRDRANDDRRVEVGAPGHPVPADGAPVEDEAHEPLAEGGGDLARVGDEGRLGPAVEHAPPDSGRARGGQACLTGHAALGSAARDAARRRGMDCAARAHAARTRVASRHRAGRARLVPRGGPRDRGARGVRDTSPSERGRGGRRGRARGLGWRPPGAARPVAFLLAPMLGRWALVVQSYGGSPARGVGKAGFREFGVASTIAFAVTLALGQAIGLVLLVVAALETIALRVVIYRCLGTLTPGALGATGAAVEAGVLLVLALLLGRG